MNRPAPTKVDVEVKPIRALKVLRRVSKLESPLKEIDQAAMLALDGGAAAANGGIHRGDMVVLATGHTFVAAVDGGTNLVDWIEISSPGGTPVKSDWAVTTVTDLAYIDNKPAIVDDLTTGGSGSLLSAQQGLVLETLKAPLASPILTGVPEAPTPLFFSDDDTIATTAFVADGLTRLKNLTVGSTTSGNETRIANMVEMTQANYDALGAYEADKLIVLIGKFDLG